MDFVRLLVLCVALSGIPETLTAESEAALRRRLLAPCRERTKRIVFTKHFDMGGSHYAYTDAVSDEDTLNPGGQVKEFNFQGGSSLCWIDLALPHSGDWTEGMTPDDKKTYMQVYRKRLDWEKQEAANIQEYLESEAPTNWSGEPDTRQH